jgi:flagellar hook-associated protein 2
MKTTLTESLVLDTDTAGTASQLGDFVTAYNDVIKLLRQNLNIGQLTDRTKTLGGDASTRTLQSSLMSVISGISNPTSSVRSLADLGIKTQGDGTLTLDQARLQKAISTDSGAVDALFKQATVGVSDKIKTLVDTYTNSTNGILVSKSKSYDQSIKQLDGQISSLQLRVDAYRTKLVSQFSAMEKIVSGFKSIGNYLTSQEANKAKNG